MLNNYFTQLNNISMTKRAEVVQHLRMYKQAENPTGILRAMAQADHEPAARRAALMGGLAGIPIALLANAVFGKDKSLRASLRAALMGGLAGGSLGGLAGAGKHLYDNANVPARKITH